MIFLLAHLVLFCLFLLSYNINQLMGTTSEAQENTNHNTGVPNVHLITLLFFCINFLCATQDIAVDGWALCMISQRNVVYASTCNTVGQTLGYVLGYIVFLALESPELCNRFRSVPQSEGFVTFSGLHYYNSNRDLYSQLKLFFIQNFQVFCFSGLLFFLSSQL